MVPIHWILRDQDWTIDPDLIFARKAVLTEIERVATRSSTVPLVLAIGDSFTAGAPFPDEKSFTAQLQRSLAQESIDIDVLNTGASGYNPDQELMVLNKVLQKGIRPKVVVWSFYINDLYEGGQWSLYTIDTNGKLASLSGTNNFIFQRQKFFEAVPLPRIVKENSALMTAVLHFYSAKIGQELPRQLLEPAANRDWVAQKIQLEIQAANQLAKQYGFTMIFVMIHPQSTYFAPELQKQLGSDGDIADVATLTQILSQEKHFIPLQFNTLIESGAYTLEQLRCIDRGLVYFATFEQEGFPPGQHHFNELGYALYGEIVKEKIRPLLLTDDQN